MGYERPEEETRIYPEIYTKLINQALQLRPISVRKASKSPIPILDVPERELPKSLTVTGVDGGSRGKELEGFYFGIVDALSYTSPVHRVVDDQPVCDGGVFRLRTEGGRIWLSLIEYGFLYRVALETVKRKHPDVLLLDGCLLLHPIYLLYKRRIGGKDLETGKTYDDYRTECARALLELFAYCYKEDIKLAGVVKRVRSTLLGFEFRDTSILDRHMQVGQRTKSIGPGKHPALSFYLNESTKVEVPRELRRELSSGKFFNIVYMKTTDVKAPIRLEIPFWVPVDDITSVVMQTAEPISGIPIHILKADNLTKARDDVFRAVYVRMMGKMLSDDMSSESLIRPIRGEEFRLMSERR